MRPIHSVVEPVTVAANQRFPSGPAAIAPLGLAPPAPPVGEGNGNLVMVPAVVISPIASDSVNHMLSSGPAVIAAGKLSRSGSGYALKVPPGVSLPIWLAPCSVNHRLPSDPLAIPVAKAPAVGTVNCSIPGVATVAVVRISPIVSLPPYASMNHNALPGPAVIAVGSGDSSVTGGTANSVIDPAVVLLPILSSPSSPNHRFTSGLGPATIGPGSAVGVGNSVNEPLVVT